MSVYPTCHIQRQPLLHASQSAAVIVRASTGPCAAAPPPPVVVQQNEVRISVVAQSIPVQLQMTAQDYCVVLCGIRCLVNLHQFRLIILKCHPKSYHPLHRNHVAPVVTPHLSPCWCHTCCLSSPRCRMKQSWHFDTVHFDTGK